MFLRPDLWDPPADPLAELLQHRVVAESGVHDVAVVAGEGGHPVGKEGAWVVGHLEAASEEVAPQLAVGGPGLVKP